MSSLIPARLRSRLLRVGHAVLLALCFPAWPLPALTAPRLPLALPGDLSLEGIAECADLRKADLTALFEAPVRELRTVAAATLRNPWGSWKRQIITNGDAVYILYSAARAGSWPVYSQGSWIVKRDRQHGELLQAKVFLKSDPGTFIRVYPDGDRSRLDLVAYDGVLAEGVPLPFPFAVVLGSRLGDLIEATRSSVDWSLFDPDPADYQVVADLAGAIRSRLPGLRYVDDGGLDAAGTPVLIATGQAQTAGKGGLNCSGFAEWVVDGLLRPAGAPWLDSAELKKKHIGLRESKAVENYETVLDPYFGLDWTRNLAVAAREALELPVRSGPKDSDVTEVPFALIAPSAAPVNGGREYEDFPPYAEDAGFPAEGLGALLFWLARTEPGNFYLASISQADRAGLRHHYHIAVLLPWFDAGGAFHVDVFESAAETSLPALAARTRGQMVHLSRVRAERAFDPPLLSEGRRP